MPKRKEVDSEFYDMNEIEATKQYLRTLNQIRKEKGALFATWYEIKSTLYSLGKRIENIFELKSDSERIYDEEMRRYYRSEFKPKLPSRRIKEDAEYARMEREGKKQQRIAERKEYILRGRKQDNLESKASATIAIISLIGGLFFLSSNITGNVIGNLTNSTSNFLGAVLIIVGLVASFFCLKKK